MLVFCGRVVKIPPHSCARTCVAKTIRDHLRPAETSRDQPRPSETAPDRLRAEFGSLARFQVGNHHDEVRASFENGAQNGAQNGARNVSLASRAGPTEHASLRVQRRATLRNRLPKSSEQSEHHVRQSQQPIEEQPALQPPRFARSNARDGGHCRCREHGKCRKCKQLQRARRASAACGIW